MDVELALKINKIIHDECKDVPHDIGLRITELMEKHRAEQLNLSGVVGQSEQLFEFLKWYDSNVCQNDCRSREDLVNDFLSQ
jgi:hypothetical protein